MSDLKYIHQRLDSLYNLDTKLVASLDDLSSILATVRKGKIQGQDETLEKEFVSNISSFYSNLSEASIALRKEIKCLDDKISNNNSSGGENEANFSILPININKKAVWTGDHKLNQEVEILNELLGEEKSNEETIKDERTEESVNEIVMG